LATSRRGCHYLNFTRPRGHKPKQAVPTGGRAPPDVQWGPSGSCRAHRGHPVGVAAPAWRRKHGSACSRRIAHQIPGLVLPDQIRRACLPCLIIRLIIHTIRRDPSGSVWTDEAPNVSRPDPSGADQIDAEHQPTDLAVGVRIPRGAPDLQVRCSQAREAPRGDSGSVSPWVPGAVADSTLPANLCLAPAATQPAAATCSIGATCTRPSPGATPAAQASRRTEERSPSAPTTRSNCHRRR